MLVNSFMHNHWNNSIINPIVMHAVTIYPPPPHSNVTTVTKGAVNVMWNRLRLAETGCQLLLVEVITW